MRRLTFLALLTLVALAAPATAQAERVAVVETFTGHVYVVGSGATWSQTRCLRGCVGFATGRVELSRFMLGEPRGRSVQLARTRLSRSRGGSNSILEVASYAASPTHAVMVEQEDSSFGDHPMQAARVFAGALRRPLGRLFTCGVFDLPYALDGGRLAFDETVCVTGSTEVVVRPLAGGPDARVSAEGRVVLALSLAGDFVAIAGRDRLAEGQPGPAAGELSVWNWTTGTEVASVPLGPAELAPVFDVAADGRLAYVIPGETCADGRLNLLTPGEPAPRELAAGTCREVSWNGAEIVTSRTGELVALTPDAGERTLLRYGTVELEDVAEDGTRLAYALPTCGGDVALELVALTGPAAFAGSPVCPARIPRQRLRMGSRRRVRLRLRCPRGCSGEVRFARRSEITSFENNGRRAVVVLRVPRALARRVRRGAFVRIPVVVEENDRSGRLLERRRTLRVLPAG